MKIVSNKNKFIKQKAIKNKVTLIAPPFFASLFIFNLFICFLPLTLIQQKITARIEDQSFDYFQFRNERKKLVGEQEIFQILKDEHHYEKFLLYKFEGIRTNLPILFLNRCVENFVACNNLPRLFSYLNDSGNFYFQGSFPRTADEIIIDEQLYIYLASKMGIDISYPNPITFNISIMNTNRSISLKVVGYYSNINERLLNIFFNEPRIRSELFLYISTSESLVISEFANSTLPIIDLFLISNGKSLNNFINNLNYAKSARSYIDLLNGVKANDPSNATWRYFTSSYENDLFDIVPSMADMIANLIYSVLLFAFFYKFMISLLFSKNRKRLTEIIEIFYYSGFSVKHLRDDIKRFFLLHSFFIQLVSLSVIIVGVWLMGLFNPILVVVMGLLTLIPFFLNISLIALSIQKIFYEFSLSIENEPIMNVYVSQRPERQIRKRVQILIYFISVILLISPILVYYGILYSLSDYLIKVRNPDPMRVSSQLIDFYQIQAILLLLIFVVNIFICTKLVIIGIEKITKRIFPVNKFAANSFLMNYKILKAKIEENYRKKTAILLILFGIGLSFLNTKSNIDDKVKIQEQYMNLSDIFIEAKPCLENQSQYLPQSRILDCGSLSANFNIISCSKIRSVYSYVGFHNNTNQSLKMDGLLADNGFFDSIFNESIIWSRLFYPIETIDAEWKIGNSMILSEKMYNYITSKINLAGLNIVPITDPQNNTFLVKILGIYSWFPGLESGYLSNYGAIFNIDLFEFPLRHDFYENDNPVYFLLKTGNADKNLLIHEIQRFYSFQILRISGNSLSLKDQLPFDALYNHLFDSGFIIAISFFYFIGFGYEFYTLTDFFRSLKKERHLYQVIGLSAQSTTRYMIKPFLAEYSMDAAIQILLFLYFMFSVNVIANNMFDRMIGLQMRDFGITVYFWIFLLFKITIFVVLFTISRRRN